MKQKFLILLVMLLGLSLSVAAKTKKPKKVFLFKLETVSTPSDKGKLISFSCHFYDRAAFNDYIYDFTVTNNTTEHISIQWENARIASSKVAFKGDTPDNMHQPKADEVISPSYKSVPKDIGRVDYLDGTRKDVWGMNPSIMYGIPDLKKTPGKTKSLDILIPIKYEDGTVEDFKLELKCWYEEVSR